MKRSKMKMFLSGTVVLLVTLVLPGCGGSSGQPIAVGLSPSVSGNSIDQGQTVTITATVSNDAKNAGVQWGVSGGGSLTAQTTTSATYNAPASVTAAFTATITATSISNPNKSSSLQIKVNPLPAITTTSLPPATAGTAYSATLVVSAGASPYKWTVTSGTLPAGLSLNSGSGVISGTPTGASSSSVTFEVTDAAGNSASRAISITVAPPPPLTITTTSLSGGTNGTPYAQTLQASGGVPPYAWLLASGSLPPGLTLSSSGVISGTPSGTATTAFTFTVSVTDSETPTHATRTATLSIAVTQPPLSIATTSLAPGSVGNPYSQTLQAIGGTPPYTWSIILGTLPTGLILNPGTGSITGTPTGTGSFTITVNVTDSAHTTVTSQPLTIVIDTALAITTTSLPGGSVGTAYSATLQATGGAEPYTWSVSSGSLPQGLSLKSNGVISGTPTAAGSPTFTVQVADSESPAVTRQATFSLTISAASCPNNFSLKGNYAFVTNGWSSTQPTATSSLGSFAADGNGNITSGLLDIADQNSSFGPASGTFTGTYCVASSRLATINLTYGGALSGGNTWIAALDSSDNDGHIISYDDSGLKVSGLLRQQNTSAFSTTQINGNFAFGLVGADQAANRYAMAGEFSANGSGTISGTDDNDDAGVIESAQTLTSSDFTVASTGRATATIASNGINQNYVFYVVSSSEMLMMAIDSTLTPPVILAGQALQQSGTFTDASLDGASVIELQSLTNTGAEPAVTAGVISTTGTSKPATYTITADQNQGGTMDTLTEAGIFSVSSKGRATLIPTGGGDTRVFYLIAQNQAFAVGTNMGVDYGMLSPQTSASFTIASLSGTYLGGSQPPVSASVNEEADNLDSNGAGSLTGTADKNSTAGTQSGTFSGTYSVSSGGPNGRLIVSQSDIPVLYLYMISTSQFVALPVSSSQIPNPDPKLIDFQQ